MGGRFDVCVIGGANLDVVARTRRLPGPGETVLASDYTEYPGGKGLNQAVAAARSGAQTAFVGALGGDAAGDRLLQVLVDEGVDVSGVIRVDQPTGRAFIVVDDNGENSIVVVSGANTTVHASAPLPESAVILAQLELAIPTVGAALVGARAAGATTVLNPAPAASLPTELLAACDVVIPNEHELNLLGGVDELLASGCRAVVTTLGGAGADIATQGSRWHTPAFRVDVVDTTGAGDAFCGALCCRLAFGDDLDAAVRWAAAAGALATTVAGAVPAQPTQSAIRTLLAER